MFKNWLVVGLLFCSLAGFAQKKELTLEQAVLQQYRQFAPDNLKMVQWIPGSEEYAYVEAYSRLMKASVANSSPIEIVNLKELNTILGSKLNWLGGIEWKNQSTFTINDGIHFYEYNYQTKKGKTLFVLDDKAENVQFQVATSDVFYTIDNNLYYSSTTVNQLAITAISDKNIVSGQTYSRNEFGIKGGIFPSPKNQFVVFAQKDESEVAEYPLVDITKTPGELMPIKYPMAGQKSEKTKIGIYHLAKKSTVFIQPQGAVDSYLTNISWTPDEQFILIAEVNREQNHMWLNKYDAQTGKLIQTLFEEKNDRWVEPEHPAFFPSEKSSNFVWISERNGFNNLYYYDIHGKLIQQLTNNKFVVKDIVQASVDGKEIIFSATGESPLNTLYYAVSLSGKQRLITKDLGLHTNFKISSNGKWIIDEFSTHSIPSKTQVLAASGKVEKVVVTAADKLADYQIGVSEIIPIKNNDGTVLYSRLIKPSNFDPTKKYPVLVYVYGGPHAQMITNSYLDDADLWMFWMAEQGYLVYTVDNRGSNYRGFEFESGIHRQLGTLEMQDQLAGVNYLKSLPYVDGNRLAVHGWSFGGFMTTSLMLRNAGVFQVGVAGGPVTDWKYYEIMYGERYMDKPEENPKGYEEASLLTHAKNLKGDLLLIHGTVDDVVVMQHNFSLVKKFVELGIQMDFFPYPMHKHNVIGKDRVHLMTKVLKYIIENNQ